MKKILVLTLTFVALFTLSACDSDTTLSISTFTSKNSFETYSTDAQIALMHAEAQETEEEELLYIVNGVTDDEMDDYKTYTNVKIDQLDNYVLLAPAYKNSILKIYTLKENEDGELETYATLFEDSSTEKGMILKARMTRSEETQYLIYVENDLSFAEYIFTVYPDGETPKTEFVLKQGEIPSLAGAD